MRLCLNTCFITILLWMVNCEMLEPVVNVTTQRFQDQVLQAIQCCGMLGLSELEKQIQETKPVTDETDIKPLLRTYKSYLNMSIDLDKNDRSLVKIWTVDFQIKLVNVTSHYRLEMTRHKEHNFKMIKPNSKWRECLELHQLEIDKAEKSYYSGESECLKVANAQERKKRHAVYQMEKEIKKWRKGYKYLHNKCKINNPGHEEAAGRCLIEYMQKDNYNVTFQRLIILKMQSVSDLYSQLLSTLQECEECLKKLLSEYLYFVRSTMKVLNRCYKRQS